LVKYVKDVYYAALNAARNFLDIYLPSDAPTGETVAAATPMTTPAAATKAPVVVFLSGGAWCIGVD
jgi:acetyl esterase/lipase